MPPPDPVWYVSYGSNMSSHRLACYLQGGSPEGTSQVYAGARDTSPPRQSIPLFLPGTVYFAGKSSVWGGGVAFYDPDLPGRTAARGYLLTVEQLSDIMAQEMHRDVDAHTPPPDLSAVVAAGRTQAGPGNYETLVSVGSRSGVPMVTFTAPNSKQEAALTPPSPPYRRVLGQGLREAHGWDSARIVRYIDDLAAG